MVEYNDMFQYKEGTAVSRLTDALRYTGTGNGETVRVNTGDLKELVNFYKSFSEEESKRKMDLDLRLDPEIINIPDGIEKKKKKDVLKKK